MLGHRITITHSAMIDTTDISEEPSNASLSIDAEAMSMETAWREAISQMPERMVAALREALR